MKYFKEKLDLDSPCSKFDIIFCAELTAPFLETPGCAYLSDHVFLLDNELDESEKFGLHLDLMQQLASSWFGGLVTNRWWDDIWIHVGLSVFLAYNLLNECQEFEKQFFGSWLHFSVDKDSAYWVDQHVHSHPVSYHIFNSAQSKTQNDQLTRIKSASAIRYLVSQIGFDAFKMALGNFVETFKLNNASGNDFLYILEDVLRANNIETDIWAWEDVWLKTPGVNQIEALMELDEGQLIGLNVVQTSAVKTSNNLRDYKIKAGFYQNNGDYILKQIEINDDSLTLCPIQKMNKPAAILLNYNDEDYVKFKLDRISYSFFRKNIGVYQV